MSALLEQGRAVLARQTFSVLLGAELTAVTEDGVTLELPLREDLKQQHGFAHGGVLCYLADNALTYVAGSVLGPNVVTVDMKINYLRPGVGERLIARASVLSSTRSYAVTRCEVYVVRDGREAMCAAAQATIGILPNKDTA